MYSSLVPTTPTKSPVNVGWLRQNSRITDTYDDALIASWLVVATDMVENYLSRYLLTRTVTWTIADDHFPAIGTNISLVPWQWTTYIQNPVLTLPRPATSVASVKIGIWAQSPDTTLTAGTDYNLDLLTSMARLQWITNVFLDPRRDHIQIVFTTGYGDTRETIPQPILQAIILIATALYTSRGDESPNIYTPAVEALLANYRYLYFG